MFTSFSNDEYWARKSHESFMRTSTYITEHGQDDLLMHGVSMGDSTVHAIEKYGTRKNFEPTNRVT